MNTQAKATIASNILFQQRRPEQYTCVICGKTFTALKQGGRNYPKYCTTACRSKAWRIRKIINNP